MLWVLLYLALAFMWFGMAFGLIEYDKWAITVAFCIVGMDFIIWALKSFATGKF